MSGLLLPLFSLHTDDDAPGNFGKPAVDFIDLLADAQLSKWLILPLGPGRVDRRLHVVRTLLYAHIDDLDENKLSKICKPLRLKEDAPWFDKCPYLPISAFAVNPFYIDTAGLGLERQDTPCMTRSLFDEPLSKEKYCPWVSGWLAKYEHLAALFASKQEVLCTDRQLLSHMRSLTLFESRCKVQRKASLIKSTQFESMAAPSTDRSNNENDRPDHQLNGQLPISVGCEDTLPKLEKKEVPVKVSDESVKSDKPPLIEAEIDELQTGECTTTAARANSLFADVETECFLPEAVSTWPDWLKEFWNFISSDENRHWVLDYAAFESALDQEALSEKSMSEYGKASFVRDWQEWRCSSVSPHERVLHLWDNSEPLFLRLDDDFCIAQEFQRSFLFHLYCQFVAVTQVKQLTDYAIKKGVHICGDCPIYLPLQSCDCWAYPEVFGLEQKSNKPRQVSGLPPDFWSAEGQLWNTPLYNWDDKVSGAEEWWSLRIRQGLKLTSEIRIDHFRAFADYWAVKIEWAQSQQNGMEGVWKKGPGASLFTRFFNSYPDISPNRIIVEDLCEITPAFLQMREAVPFARMEVLQFHLEHLAAHKDDDHTDSWLIGKAKGPLVIFSGTHDNPPLKEWMELSASEAAKELVGEQLGRVPMRSDILPRFLIAWMMKQVQRSCSGQEVTVYVPVQDVLCLGVEGRLNRPGAFDPSMWSWRLSAKQMEELKGLVNWMRESLKVRE